MKRFIALVATLLMIGGCGGDGDPAAPPSRPSTQPPPPPPPPPPPAPTVPVIAVAGHGEIKTRFTAELWVQRGVAYTTTWGRRNGVPGNAVFIWDVTGDSPLLRDSVIVSGAETLGDVQATDDGRYLVVATEYAPGSIVMFDLTDPFKPREVSRFVSPAITDGVHTVEVQRVNGRNYAFLAANPARGHPPRLIIVDLGDPAAPREVFKVDLGRPFMHDVFVRDGILFTAEWHDGMSIWDIGGGGRGGTPANPIALGNVRTVNGSVHNIWWFHDPSNAAKRYVFVGEEGPGSIGNSSSGDLHVVDVSDLTRPVEVAAYRVAGAGAHNVSVDEPNGLLYAAFYNGGVRVLDVRGDLGTCTADQKFSDGRCDLAKMGREKGVGLLDQGKPVFVWGVHFMGTHVYASDFLNGIWKLKALSRS